VPPEDVFRLSHPTQSSVSGAAENEGGSDGGGGGGGVGGGGNDPPRRAGGGAGPTTGKRLQDGRVRRPQILVTAACVAKRSGGHIFGGLMGQQGASTAEGVAQRPVAGALVGGGGISIATVYNTLERFHQARDGTPDRATSAGRAQRFGMTRM